MDSGQGVYCPHIEDKIPSMGRGRMRIASDRQQENLAESQQEDPGLESLIKKLQEFGLPPYQVDLICAKFGEERSLSQIAKDLGWISGSSVAYHIGQALQELRKRGFK